MNREAFICKAVETYLFWTRIMKEHAIFIEGSLPPTQSRQAVEANQYCLQFTALLQEIISLSNGVLSYELLHAGQFYTDFTTAAERDFQRFFGLEINTALTEDERNILPREPGMSLNPRLTPILMGMNRRLLELTAPFIRFQTDMLTRRLACAFQFGLFPSALNHLLDETKMFEEQLLNLQADCPDEPANVISFWNRGMSEHAKSLRSQLDWSEESCICAANSYAGIYDKLSASPPNCERALKYTPAFGKFAAHITQSTLSCQLTGILSALYCDHLFREVNYYTRQLRCL